MEKPLQKSLQNAHQAASRNPAAKRLITLAFALTIFVSAFLLFQIQPMIGKFILPWFGGSSAVWTTSMLFFQVLLLGGYAYAHYLSGMEPRRQGRIHLFVLLIVFLLTAAAAYFQGTPITPDPRWKPEGGSFPTARILWVLAASVGIPYFLLSTTSSLIQSWFRDVQQRSSPYAFYALSNIASLIALLSYPVLFEPNLTLHEQAVFWSAGFALFLLCSAGCALLLRRHVPNGAAAPAVAAPAVAEAAVAEAAAAEVAVTTPAERADEQPVERPTWRSYALWIMLSATASVMLLATTNHVAQDLSSTPFLWVLPLSLYLLSFAISFNDRQVKLRSFYVLLTLGALMMGYLNLDRGSNVPILYQILSNAVLLFIICMLCHTELYARRPHPRHLTIFYLMVSIGGALGGLIVSILAPLIFNDYWEYHLGLLVAAVVAVMIAFRCRGNWIHWLRFPVALASAALMIMVFSTTYHWISSSILMTRSFYGVLRVRQASIDGDPVHRLMHGGILHGSQAQTDALRRRPTTYYTESTGVGLAYQNHPTYTTGQPMRAAVVGLGVGTMAAYGREGDTIRFYEINPEVLRLASNPKYFTYLLDSPAEVDVVLGDARLSMERELREDGSQNYDLLAVDAFSGDSIPTHLINKEAMAVYLAHLKQDGILAFHVSNRHIELEPIVALLAEEYGLESVEIHGGSSDWQGSYAVWVLLSRQTGVLSVPEIDQAAQPLVIKPGLRIWTDDYSNLIQVLR